MTFTTTFKRGDSVEHREESLCRGTFLRYVGDGTNAVVDFIDGGQSTVPFADIKHAPVRVVGPILKKSPTHCPHCGGELTLDNAALKFTPSADGRKPTRKKVAILACGGCEYVYEVPR